MKFQEVYKRYPKLFREVHPIPLRYLFQNEKGEEIVINFAFFPPLIKGVNKISSSEKKEIKRNLIQILHYWQKRGLEFPDSLFKVLKFI